MWAKFFSNCSTCGTAKRKHTAKGLCTRCYSEMYRKDPRTRDRVRKQKLDWYLKQPKGFQKNSRDMRNFSGLREEVLARDNYLCTSCGNPDLLLVHHIDGNGRGTKNPNNDLENLKTLCRSCHAKVHGLAEYCPGTGSKPTGKWARKYTECRHCKTTRLRHASKGLCRTCYVNEKRRKGKEDIVRSCEKS